MSETTIEWTATLLPNGVKLPGYTFNPWIGCTHVHAGCANCYAEADFDRRKHYARWGLNGTRVLTSEANWKKPLKWDREAREAGERRKVFCASLADLFEDWPGPVRNHHGQYGIKQGDPDGWAWKDAPVGGLGYPSNTVTLDDVRRKFFDLVTVTPNLDWLLLTKRPQNIRRMWPALTREQGATTRRQHDWLRRNVFLGTSVSDQASADKQIPELLRCRNLSPVLFLSIEPLLGPVDLGRWLVHGIANWECQKCGAFQTNMDSCRLCGASQEYLCGSHAANHRDPTRFTGNVNRQPIDWVIVGGESGPHARPMHPAWVTSIRDQCRDAGVPFFFKQNGEYIHESQVGIDVKSDVASRGFPEHLWPDGSRSFRVGKKTAGRCIMGWQWNGFPLDPLDANVRYYVL